MKIDEIHLSATIRACARAFAWQSAVALLYNSAAFAVQQERLLSSKGAIFGQKWQPKNKLQMQMWLDIDLLFFYNMRMCVLILSFIAYL